MTMANDDPTSMHMLFGGLGAYTSGVTNYKRPRAGKSAGMCMDFDLRERKAEERIQVLEKQHPELKPLALKILDDQKVRREYSAQLMLWELERELKQRKLQRIRELKLKYKNNRESISFSRQ